MMSTAFRNWGLSMSVRIEQKSYSSLLSIMEKSRCGVCVKRFDRTGERLFRRVAFNVAIGNRDDHLRNHGFILTSDGWRLAPAFDVNPNIEKAAHVLNLDETDNRPSLETVIDTSEWYPLSKDRGAKIVYEIAQETRQWRQRAAGANIARADIELTAAAFALSEADFVELKLSK